MRNGVTFRRFDQFWTVSAEFRKLGPRVTNKHLEQPRFISQNQARQMLASDRHRAEARAREILNTAPHDPMARYVMGAILRSRKELEAARAILEPLTASQPQMATAWRELGLVLAEMGEDAAAVSALLRCIDLGFMEIDAWYALGDLLTFPAPDGYEPACPDRRIDEAAAALREARLDEAEAILRELIRATPDKPVARKLLADTLIRGERWAEARPHLEAALDVSPGYVAARFRLATMLFAHGHFEDSLTHIAELLRDDPDDTLYRSLKAMALCWSRQFEPAIAEFKSLLVDCPVRPGLWLEYARLLGAARHDGSAEAFKKTIELLPSCVDAYLGLANMKSVRVEESWIEPIRAQLARSDLAAEDRARLHFVLGKLFEDAKRYKESFENYEASNEILLHGRRYGVEASTGHKRLTKQLFTPAFFRQRQGSGHPERGAIFIVGIPRSGSTLVEQILSCHSEIEGLGELEDMNTIISGLTDPEKKGPPYPIVLGTLGADRLRALGEEYMKLTRARRKTNRYYFTDKLLSNFGQIGLIHLILPNARIIDVRRHPLDCGLSCYKHYFPFGQPITYRLEDIGRAYADYVELMAHFDDILPGRVYRIQYERLIENPEDEVRRLLAHLGLPFEEQCLRFHESKRHVMTLSHDQVRMPLYRNGMDQWRHYEAWLGPLKKELGYLLDVYPEVPKFYAQVNARLRARLSLGAQGNLFSVVKGLRQIPFESAA